MQLNKTGMEHFRPHCTAGNGTRRSKEGLRAELECVGGDTYGDGVDRGGGGGVSLFHRCTLKMRLLSSYIIP